jgi:hypothetical protein
MRTLFVRFRNIACAIVFVAWPAAAQWLHYPTPGIPRMPDGKPNLLAPAPHTADGKPYFTGMWRTPQSASGETDKAIHNLKAQPWAEAVSKTRKDNLGSDSAGVLCLPFGPRVDGDVGKIIQAPSFLIMLFEDLTYRQVFLDGRPLPDDPNPTWMGYSVGHWDKDTLVIESAGFNDRTWLDGDGHPHTEALHVTERLRRPDFGHLELMRTIEDPKALVQPLVVPIKFEFDADTEMLEYVCAENERDRSHLIGKASDDKKAEVKVAPEILRQYVGLYEFKPPDRPDDPLLLDISVDDGRLMVAFNEGTKQALSAESDTKFFFEGAHVEFVKDAGGAVTYFNLQVVEGDFKVIRKK